MNPSISFASFASLFGSIGVILSLLLVGVLMWAIARTRSTYLVMFRLWRLASGGAELHDEKIRDYFRDQHALISFRFVTGLVVHRTQDVHALIDWGKQRQIDIEQMSRAGEYFDPNRKIVDTDRLSRKWRLRGMFMATLTSWLLLMVTGLALAVFFDEALVRFTATRSYFTIQPDSAKRVLRWAETFRVTHCNAVASKARAGFSVEEQAVLCKAFKDPDASREIMQNISSQRTGLAWLLVALVFSTIITTWAIERVRSARKLAEALNARTQGKRPHRPISSGKHAS